MSGPEQTGPEQTGPEQAGPEQAGPEQAGAQQAGGGGPSAEDLVAELRKAKVSDLLVQTCSLLASLGFGKLAPEARDLEQARLAVEALKALAPLLPDEPRRDVQQVIANLQLAFADAAAQS